MQLARFVADRKVRGFGRPNSDWVGDFFFIIKKILHNAHFSAARPRV
jgi:hypothetical protein